MGVTAIRVVENKTDRTAEIRNRETPSDTASGRGDVPPQSTQGLYMWIPWCTDSGSFSKRHISVDLKDPGGTVTDRFVVWQADRGGSDHVRVATDGAWHDPGDGIGGRSTVNGDRVLEIGPAGLSLRTFAPPRPEPPSQGTDWVSFSRPDKSTFTFTGRSGGPYPYRDATILRVTNTARNVNGDVGVPLDLQLVDEDGRAAGPVHLEPGAIIGPPFEGLLVAGAWTAKAVSISNALLDNDFMIEVTWHADPAAERAEVVISGIRKDPPGSDVKPDEGEYAELKNVGAQQADVGEWYLEDLKTRITIPPGYSIDPDATMRVYTGPGTNTQDRYYAGRQRAVWNNTGDSARLYTNRGTLAAEFIYP
jgi:hypothetical protein